MAHKGGILYETTSSRQEAFSTIRLYHQCNITICTSSCSDNGAVIIEALSDPSKGTIDYWTRSFWMLQYQAFEIP